MHFFWLLNLISFLCHFRKKYCHKDYKMVWREGKTFPDKKLFLKDINRSFSGAAVDAILRLMQYLLCTSMQETLCWCIAKSHCFGVSSLWWYSQRVAELYILILTCYYDKGLSAFLLCRVSSVAFCPIGVDNEISSQNAIYLICSSCDRI